MNTVIVRDVVIGEGRPKICIPIIGVTREEIIEEAKALGDFPADIVEWRADWFEQVFDVEKVIRILEELRVVLKETPILFTFRTAKEGGKKTISAKAYEELNQAAAATGYVDLIDVEAFMGDEVVKTIIEEAHQYNVKVVGSNHDFNKTPDKDEIVARLRKMQKLGADISKIAVMPQSKRDVLTLLSATEEMYTEYADKPIVTMSMAGMGVLSRICGEVFGSAITFGVGKKASAPGQIPAKELERMLAFIHKSV